MPAAPPAGRSSTCPSRAAGPAPRAGALIMLAGGEASDLAAIARVLDAISSSVRHFGPVGSGTRFKLVLNALQAAHLVAFGEAMALARSVGLDPDDVGPALVERLGGPVTTMAVGRRSAAPGEGELRPGLGVEGSSLRRGDGRRPADSDARRGRRAARRRSGEGLGRTRLDRRQRSPRGGLTPPGSLSRFAVDVDRAGHQGLDVGARASVPRVRVRRRRSVSFEDVPTLDP